MILLLWGCATPMACGDGEGTVDLDASDAALYDGSMLPRFAIGLDDAALAALPDSAKDPDRGEDVHTTFTWRGERWDAGLHIKGHSSFQPLPRKSAFKIDFHQWDAEASFHGIRHLTLNNMVGDPSEIAEELAYGLYEALGLPASRHGYACVAVNGEDFGVYGVVETPDQAFLDAHFDDPSGNLYEGNTGADIPAFTHDNFQLQEESEDGTAPGDDLAALSAAYADAPDVLGFLDAHFDREAVLDAWAAEMAMGNIDGYVAHTNNFLLYHEPGPDRWWFLPWGVDETWVDDVDPDDPGQDQMAKGHGGFLYADCLAEAACADAMRDARARVAERMDTLGFAASAADLVGEMAQVTRHDEKSAAGPWDTRVAQDGVLRHVRAAPRHLRAAAE